MEALEESVLERRGVRQAVAAEFGPVQEAAMSGKILTELLSKVD